MQEPTPARSFQRGWRGIALVSFLLLVTTVVVILWWWYDDSDLRVVKQRAQSLGIPLTWAETGRMPIDGERLALWREMSALTATFGFDSPKTESAWRAAFAPIPPELAERHRDLVARGSERLVELIDRLGSEPVVLGATRSMRQSGTSEHILYKNVAAYLGERLTLATEDVATHECLRLLDFIATIETPDLMGALTSGSCFERALHLIAERLPSLKKDATPIAMRLALLADRLAAGWDQAGVGEFLILLDLVEHPPSYKECASLFMVADGSWDSQPTPFMFRSGRRHLLDTQLDWVLYLRTKPDPRDVIARAKAQEGAIYDQWRSENRLNRFFLPPNDVSLAFNRTRMHARLLIAALDDQPWPIDEFDPQLQPLRRLERDGVLIGTYSFGNDGVDDGGKKGKDFRFPLYGAIEAPPTKPVP